MARHSKSMRCNVLTLPGCYLEGVVSSPNEARHCLDTYVSNG
jgi:hypothetical protein